MKKLLNLLLLISLMFLFTHCGDNEGEPEYETETTITNDGGKFEIKDKNSPIYGAYVDVPKGALKEGVTISIKDVTSEIKVPGDPKSIILSFTPDGIEFEKPIEIGLPVAKGIDIDEATPFYYDAKNCCFTNMPIVRIDRENNMLIAETNHFSDYYVSDEKVYCSFEFKKMNNALVSSILVGKKNDYASMIAENNKMAKAIKGIPINVDYMNAFDLLNSGTGSFKLILKKRISYWFDKTIAERNYTVKKDSDNDYNIEICEDGNLVKVINYGFSSSTDNVFEEDSYSSYFAGGFLYTVFDDVAFEAGDKYYIDVEWQIADKENNIETPKYIFKGYDSNKVKDFKKLEEFDIEDKNIFTHYPLFKIEPINKITSNYALIKASYLTKGLKTSNLEIRLYKTEDLSDEPILFENIAHDKSGINTNLGIESIDNGKYYAVCYNSTTKNKCSNIISFEKTQTYAKEAEIVSVTPDEVNLNEETVFTIEGINLTKDLVIDLDGLDKKSFVSLDEEGTVLKYKGTPTGEPGEREGKIKNSKGEVVKKFKVTYVGNPSNTAPTKPSLLKPLNEAINQSGNILTFEWANSTDVDGDKIEYIVMYSLDKSDWTIMEKTEKITNSAVLEPGKLYYWKVKASDGKAHSISDIWSFTTQKINENTPPTKPTLSEPANNAIDQNFSSLQFKWEASTDINEDEIKYTFVYSLDKNNWTMKSETSDLNFEMDFAPATKYYWYVRASDGKKATNSDIWTFTTKQESAKLLSPINNATSQNYNSLQLKWENNKKLNYYLNYSIDKKEWFSIDKGDACSHILNIKPNTTYYWYINQKGGARERSAMWSFTTKAEEEQPPVLAEEDYIYEYHSNGKKKSKYYKWKNKYLGDYITWYDNGQENVSCKYVIKQNSRGEWNSYKTGLYLDLDTSGDISQKTIYEVKQHDDGNWISLRSSNILSLSTGGYSRREETYLISKNGKGKWESEEIKKEFYHSNNALRSITLSVVKQNSDGYLKSVIESYESFYDDGSSNLKYQCLVKQNTNGEWNSYKTGLYLDLDTSGDISQKTIYEVKQHDDGNWISLRSSSISSLSTGGYSRREETYLISKNGKGKWESEEIKKEFYHSNNALRSITLSVVKQNSDGYLQSVIESYESFHDDGVSNQKYKCLVKQNANGEWNSYKSGTYTDTAFNSNGDYYYTYQEGDYVVKQHSNGNWVSLKTGRWESIYTAGHDAVIDVYTVYQDDRGYWKSKKN